MRLSRPHRRQILPSDRENIGSRIRVLFHFRFPKIAERFFEEVTLETKESSSASVRDGHDIVYVAHVQTRRIMSVSLGNWQSASSFLYFFVG